jgi:CHASE2 domain-containing sensor protein
MKRKQLYKEALVASLLVIAVDFLLSFVPWKFELIKPIKQGFNDFNVYDLRYSGEDSLYGRKDTDITLLEIGGTRREIAEEIARVSALHPRVIGVDAMFHAPGDSRADDSVLIAAMRGAQHLVLASVTTDTQVVRSFMQDRLPMVGDGYYDFVEGPDEIRRHIRPFRRMDDTLYPSLTARMLKEADPQAYAGLTRRRNRFEMINYQGDLNHYNVVSLHRFLHPEGEQDQASYFRDKIVLIGFFKEEPPYVLEDMHFTPMNSKRGGKSFPDSYGVVIHANILEMMLKDEYIHELPPGVVYLMTFFIIFLINILYIHRLTRGRGHNEFILFLLQFVLAIGLLYLSLLLFDVFDLAFDQMPLLIAVVLSFEIFWFYEWLARQLHNYFKYETFVSSTEHPGH